ncbi:hypothetical protein E2C01_076661 [Portunus trituberculatus]|uniref:Uncharacterized protein n=1 Tax=Portunus trituberculatus TaxID=210409 RepID=A0A5B7IMM2_PORTR|nr:hypothetical protein [Portunus trituberculatus]
MGLLWSLSGTLRKGREEEEEEKEEEEEEEREYCRVHINTLRYEDAGNLRCGHVGLEKQVGRKTARLWGIFGGVGRQRGGSDEAVRNRKRK